MASPSSVLVFVACIGLATGWLVEADASFNCYTGVYAENGLQNGTTVACNGMCGVAQTNLPVGQTTAFFCWDQTVCAGLGLDGTTKNCTTLQQDAEVTTCCCTGDNCNIAQANLTDKITPPPVQSITDPPIACYTGVWTHGQAASPGGYQVCQGDCLSITLTTTGDGGDIHTASIYGCDPSMACRNLGILGKCSNITNGLYGCCCDSDTCIDPNKGRVPYQPLVCFAGVTVPQDNYAIGDDVTCDGGKCISVETTVQGKQVKVFQCASKAVCQTGLQIEGDDCTSFMNGGTNVKACCCDNGDNCNVLSSDNLGDKLPLANWTKAPLACWNGFYQNGVAQGNPGWASCKGDCVSMTWKTSSSSDTMTLYTCDPAQVLNDWGVNEDHCGSVDGVTGLKVCSCAKSGCLDGTSNIPNTLVNKICTVGVQMGQNFTGQSIYCGGHCASMMSTINGVPTIAYFCADSVICDTLKLENACGPVPGDNDVQGCCCDNADNCNIAISNSTLTPPANPTNVTDTPIACYTGIWVNHQPISPVTYQSCIGDCVSISMHTMVAGVNHTASIYACDPSTVCRNLGILGGCSPIQEGMNGCCCDTDDCIDPYKGRFPGRPLICFAGVTIPQDNYTRGDDVACDGKCVSIETTVATSTDKKRVKVFQCASKSVCQTGLQIEGDDCTTFQSGGTDVRACCCDNANNCNVSPTDNISNRIPLANWTQTPLACWSGFYQNKVPQGTVGWSSCNGDCVSLQWKVSDQADTMTLFTCDPAQFLRDLEVNDNSCSPIEGINGLKACTCDKSGCMDGSSNVPNNLAGLTCYVGVQTNQNSNGTTVYCNGKCASMSATIQGNFTTAFFCADTSVCDNLKLQNQCGPVPGDNDVLGCCCDYANNCNIDISGRGGTITAPDTPSQFTDPPISCYTGVWVNGSPLNNAPAVYQSCEGDCVSIALNTTVAGANHTATIFTCDPSTVCRNLGILGNCSAIQDGMIGCCCASDVCINPYKGINPAHPLTCFAGFSVPADNLTQGDVVACDGKCISVETQVSNKTVKVFQCVQPDICKGMNILDNGCKSFMSGTATVNACCCDETSNCNAGNLDLSNIPKANLTNTPLACWSGFYMDKTPQGAVGWANCNGDCASIQWKTNDTETMTLYTCDPVLFVQQFGVDNTCGTVDSLEGLKVCSCSTNGCLDGSSNVPIIPTPQTCPSLGSSHDLWIFVSLFLLTILYRR